MDPTQGHTRSYTASTETNKQAAIKKEKALIGTDFRILFRPLLTTLLERFGPGLRDR